MRDVVIVEAVRTPVGRRNGRLKGIHAVELAAKSLREVVRRANLDPARVDQVIWGCVSQVGEQAFNVGRWSLLQAGYPIEVPGHLRGLSVRQQPAGGALCPRPHRLRPGRHHRRRRRGGHEPRAHVQHHSERPRRALDRRDQGAVPPGSPGHLRRGDRPEVGHRPPGAGRVQPGEPPEGRRGHPGRLFKREIVPVQVTLDDGTAETLDRDEGIRYDTSLEKLAGLKPSFLADGVVTAGNSSQISDGSAAHAAHGRRHGQGAGPAAARPHRGPGRGGRGPAHHAHRPHPGHQGRAQARRPEACRTSTCSRSTRPSPASSWPGSASCSPDMSRVNVRAAPSPWATPWAAPAPADDHAAPRAGATGGRYGLQTMCCGGGMGTGTIIERL